MSYFPSDHWYYLWYPQCIGTKVLEDSFVMTAMANEKHGMGGGGGGMFYDVSQKSYAILVTTSHTYFST